MSKAVIDHAPLNATLKEQKADFTAEGAPPPGKVLASTPVTPREAAAGTPANAAPMKKSIKLKRPAESR